MQPSLIAASLESRLKDTELKVESLGLESGKCCKSEAELADLVRREIEAALKNDNATEAALAGRIMANLTENNDVLPAPTMEEVRIDNDNRITPQPEGF